MGKIRIGISGWSYAGWRGDFYPDDLPQKQELSYAAEQLDTIEINGSFYRLQSAKSYRSWYEDAPAGFRFAVKGSRFITHNKKLGDAKDALANFLASGIFALKEKLGPVLWQLPASAKFDAERLANFLELLPKDTEQAAKLARRHDGRVSDPMLTPDRSRRMRHVLEPRNESFWNPELVRLLRNHNVGLVVSESPDWPLFEELTAGVVYIRLHGSEETYASRYSDRELDRWAERVVRWRDGGEPDDAARITDRRPPQRKSRDVYVFFDNDQKVHAPKDALRLRERVGGQ